MNKKELLAYVPDRYQKYFDKETLAVLAAEPDSHIREVYRDNLIQFVDVFNGQGVNFKKYMLAVKFCTYRLLGDTILEAYEKTFPLKVRNWRIEKRSSRYMDAAASQFSRSLLVTKIMQRSLVPVHILNMDLHQEAINKQAELMRTAKSEMVRMKAAECLIRELKQPEEQKVSIDVNHRSDALDELKKVTRDLALAQRKAISQGSVEVIDVVEAEIVSQDEGTIQ